MARTFNQVTLIGHLGSDPVFTKTDKGTPLVKFRMATDRYQGPDRESIPDWHNVVCWNNNAVAVNQYLHKGSRVHVVGPMLQNRWQSEDGINHSRVEVRADSVIFLDNPNFSPVAETVTDEAFEGIPGTDENFGETNEGEFNKEFKDALATAPSEVA